MTAPLDPDVEAAIRQRAERATPGHWFVDGRINETTYRCEDGFEVARRNADNITERVLIVDGVPEIAEPDAYFVAKARQDIPTLLAEIDRLRTACVAAERRGIERAAAECHGRAEDWSRARTGDSLVRQREAIACEQGVRALPVPESTEAGHDG